MYGMEMSPGDKDISGNNALRNLDIMTMRLTRDLVHAKLLKITVI